MEGIGLTVALYDIIGILVPGLVCPVAAGLIAKDCLSFYGQSTWIVLLWGYVLGHVVQAVSKLGFRLVDKVWNHRGFIELAHPDLKGLILRDLRSFYGPILPHEAAERHMKDLCYSPVWNRMDNYKLFIALADLCRALAFLSGLASLLLAGGVFGIWTCTVGQRVRGLVLLGVLGGFVLLTDRSRFFRRLADGVVYHSFLAFVAEGNLSMRQP